jgi:hypothetical protein
VILVRKKKKKESERRKKKQDYPYAVSQHPNPRGSHEQGSRQSKIT